MAVAKKEKNPNVKPIKKNYKLLLYLLPGIVFVIMFSYVPLAGWIIGFMNYKPGIPLSKTPFVGLDNFKILMEDSKNMLRVMKNTAIFALLGYLTAPLSMVLAIALNEVRSSKLKRLIQTLTTFPHFVSWVIVYALAFQFFSFDGKVSAVLMDLGWIKEPFSLIADQDAVYWFQTALGLWKGLGWSSIVYLAAIAGIDREQFEAAEIDGASRMQRIRYITIPSLMPTFIVLMLLQVSSFVNSGLDQYLNFYNTVVKNNIETIDLYVYRATLLKSDYSYGTVIGMSKSLISIMLLLIVNNLSKRVRDESIF